MLNASRGGASHKEFLLPCRPAVLFLSFPDHSSDDVSHISHCLLLLMTNRVGLVTQTVALIKSQETRRAIRWIHTHQKSSLLRKHGKHSTYPSRCPHSGPLTNRGDSRGGVVGQGPAKSFSKLQSPLQDHDTDLSRRLRKIHSEMRRIQRASMEGRLAARLQGGG